MTAPDTTSKQSELGGIAAIDIITLQASGPGAPLRYGNVIPGTPGSDRSPSSDTAAHAYVYRNMPEVGGVVHTHSTYATALSCLDDLDDDDVLPPLTAYFVMRVGRLVRLPYFAPGDQGLAEAAQKAAASTRGLLLANHGPIVSAPSLAQAVDAVEEVEETARLFFLLQGRATRPLQPAQVAQL